MLALCLFGKIIDEDITQCVILVDDLLIESDVNKVIKS
jgi:hypothetical protein